MFQQGLYSVTTAAAHASEYRICALYWHVTPWHRPSFATTSEGAHISFSVGLTSPVCSRYCHSYDRCFLGKAQDVKLSTPACTQARRTPRKMTSLSPARWFFWRKRRKTVTPRATVCRIWSEQLRGWATLSQNQKAGFYFHLLPVALRLAHVWASQWQAIRLKINESVLRTYNYTALKPSAGKIYTMLCNLIST